jgi:hypothetical protein
VFHLNNPSNANLFQSLFWPQVLRSNEVFYCMSESIFSFPFVCYLKTFEYVAFTVKMMYFSYYAYSMLSFVQI